MLAQRLLQLRWTPLLVFTAACLAIGEQFPFSDFPMYSSFGRETYYVYLADAEGRPLPTLETIGMTTPILKKIYDRELQREVRRLRTKRRRMSTEQKSPVGARVLQSLQASLARQGPDGEPARVLRLYEVNISVEDGRFVRRTDLIAEL